MRSHSQSLIGVARKYVNIWRRRNQWSQGTVVEEIIKVHDRIDGIGVSGIRFEPHTVDAYDRQRINGERVFRWLDDETKDNNLLPANFVQSVIAALPVDLRLACVDEILLPLGMAGTIISDKSGDLNAAALVQKVAKEGGEATAALAVLVDGATPDELRNAHQELSESLSAHQVAIGRIETALKRAA